MAFALPSDVAASYDFAGSISDSSGNGRDLSEQADWLPTEYASGIVDQAMSKGIVATEDADLLAGFDQMAIFIRYKLPEGFISESVIEADINGEGIEVELNQGNVSLQYWQGTVAASLDHGTDWHTAVITLNPKDGVLSVRVDDSSEATETVDIGSYDEASEFIIQSRKGVLIDHVAIVRDRVFTANEISALAEMPE